MRKKSLLESDSDPNIHNLWGNKPLNLAADNGHSEIVQVLLEAGGIPREIREGLGNPRSPVLIFRIGRRAETQIILNWQGGSLQKSNAPNGNWQIEDEKESGSLTMNSDQAAFFRIVASQ